MRSILVSCVLGASLLALPVVSGSSPMLFAQAASSDAQIQADITKGLNNKRFSNVKVSMQNGIVVLSGTVALFADKEEAEHKAHQRSKNAKGVENQIQVAGPPVEDSQLLRKLSDKLVYDRVGYGTTAFNAFTLGVHNGVVTVGGTAYGPMDKDSALSAIAYYPGVKDIVDNIEVAPVSPMDDRIRIATARAIYGAPQLNQYALDPAKPIRITVVNGRVTLSGVVDRQSDKDVANIRANGVPGVFKVTNNLQVANSSEKK